MFGNIFSLFKKKNENEENKSTAKERLHLVLMQDRANVSADFLDLMKQEIIEVIKKYIEVDENQIDVKLTNKVNGDGTTGAPALYANIPIKSLKKETRINLNKELLKEQDDSNGGNKSNEETVNVSDVEIVKIKEEDEIRKEVEENKNQSDNNETKVTEQEDNQHDTEEKQENESIVVEPKENNSNEKSDEKETIDNENKNVDSEQEKKEEENKRLNNGNNNKNKKKNRNNKKNEGITFFDNIKDEDNKTDEK